MTGANGSLLVSPELALVDPELIFGADTEGKEKVTLGAGTTKYRHVLLWFTAPPANGSTVRISELKILG